MNILRYDNFIMTGISRFADYVCLGILWIIASIPVITFGAAATAAIQTAENVIFKEEGKIIISFWKCFKKEFKQATAIWLIQLPVLAVLVIDLQMVMNSDMANVLRVIIYIALSIIFCWVQLWFGYLSKFEDKTKILLSNTFRIMILSFGRTFLMGVISLLSLLATVVGFFLMPLPLLLIPGLYLMGYTSLMRKIFTQYLPRERISETEEKNM